MREVNSSRNKEPGSDSAGGLPSERQKIDYQKVFENAPALFLLLGADDSFPILDASNAYLRAIFAAREGIVGHSLFDIFPDNPDDQEATGTANLYSSLKQVLADGQPHTMAVQKYDIRRPASEGGGFEERYWSPINTPVFGPDGRMLFIMHHVEDVTELWHSNRALAHEGETMRREAMSRGQELEEANRQLRQVTEQFQAMYDQGLFAARLRLDGTVADINRSAVEVCGFNRADILDRPFWECGWWNRSPEVQAWVRHAVEQAVSGEPFRGESLYFWGDGSEHVVDFACMPIKDAAGRVVVVVPTGMDITERVQGEQNHRALEAERRRAETLAEIDRAKTQFFANISHEFRTPLTLMLGPLEDALTDTAEPLNAAQQERLALIQRNGLRLQKLVNALLDFSRVESGRIQAAYQSVDLPSLTRGLASSFRSACDKAGLSLTIDAEPMPRPVLVDPEMWEKIVLNLVSNAFKFTFAGGIAISLGADGDSAILTVTDTGTGIPANQLPLIFERFHRVEGAAGRTHEGTGIGLALVQELVKFHRGSIGVESSLGTGTRFTVRIPLGDAQLPMERLGQGVTQVSTATRAEAFVEEALRWLPDGIQLDVDTVPIDGPRARILLADDNADMRDYLKRLLAPAYDVTAVADGEAALAAARYTRPNLLVSDVMMPGLDGFGLLQAIRADAALRELPVILLSARAGEAARIEGLDAGADDYLIKPFSARELMARISASLKLSDLRRQAKEAVEEREERLRQLNVGLEDRVAFEVAERMKTEEALRQSQKMEAVGQLTGGVAHDFNNLLTVILGGLDTIRRSKPGDAARVTRALDMATQGALRATSLTSRLLAFSRRQPLDPKPHDLNLVVRDMTDMLHRTLGENIELEGVLSPRLWQIEIDRNQLESAILNLAVNARDAMPDGGQLTIETANTALDEHYAASDAEVIPGQYVVIAVSDTGHGMSNDTLSHAFEPFYTTKQDGRGTGLGLSQVYGFAKQSRGHVTIYSEPSQGTTVKLYFPRRLGEEVLTEPMGKRFWALTRKERAALGRLFDDDEIRGMITSLQDRESGDRVEMVDAAYWMKGCSSLGRLRDAVMVRVGHGRDAALCLVDVKEATAAAAPRKARAPMPRDNAVRVVRGARALSPNLGERMIASRLLDVGVVLRELMPQDLKIDIERLTWEESTTLATYLAGVIGRAHARQLDVATRQSWQKELTKARTAKLDAPSWLWSSVVDLLAIHERAYLEHCHRFALAEAA